MNQLPEAYRQLAAKMPEQAIKACVSAAYQGHKLMVERTTAAKPFAAVDRGKFRRSWKVQPLTDGAAITNDAPYASVVELGRRPNQPGPPLAPILEWVIRKYDALKNNGKKTTVRSLEVLRKRGEHKAGSMASIWKASGYRAMLNDATGIAYAIRAKIHKYGTEPRNIMGAPEAQASILGHLRASLARAFGDI